MWNNHCHRVTTQLQLINNIIIIIIIIIIICYSRDRFVIYLYVTFIKVKNISKCVRKIIFGLLWPILLLCVLKRFWCQLRKGGEITAPKHVVSLRERKYAQFIEQRTMVSTWDMYVTSTPQRPMWDAAHSQSGSRVLSAMRIGCGAVLVLLVLCAVNAKDTGEAVLRQLIQDTAALIL